MISESTATLGARRIRNSYQCDGPVVIYFDLVHCRPSDAACCRVIVFVIAYLPSASDPGSHSKFVERWSRMPPEPSTLWTGRVPNLLGLSFVVGRFHLQPVCVVHTFRVNGYLVDGAFEIQTVIPLVFSPQLGVQHELPKVFRTSLRGGDFPNYSRGQLPRSLVDQHSRSADPE